MTPDDLDTSASRTLDPAAAAQAIRDGRTALGIELGSTRIKACLVLADDPSTVLAVGSHAWENRFVDRLWTYAIDDVCTHDGGPLGEGQLEGFTIACPRHGAKFDVRDGRALTMPATKPTVAHEVKVEGDDVYVRLND